LRWCFLCGLFEQNGGSRVLLSQIELSDFRNYERAACSPAPGINVVTGENAAGKTNFLEAVYFALCGGSFRSSRENEVVRFGAEKAIIRACVSMDGFTVNTAAEVRSDGKTLVLNGKDGQKRDFPGRRRTLLFRPEDLEVLTGPPAGRRRFIDQIFFGLVPAYEEAHRQFYRALQQRNALLRLGRGMVPETGEFKTWTDACVTYGTRLCRLRLNGLALFAPAAASIYRQLTGTKIFLRYVRSIGGGESEAEVRELFYVKLHGLLAQELRYGHTMAGPHRDDFIFMLKDNDLRRHGSRGEQRTAVLAMKLAEAGLLEKSTDDRIVYLLDDVFSELDRRRRQALLENIVGRQAFITATETPIAADGAVYRVENGKICRTGTEPT
jgi:DNA replication and repair protein RecF